MNKASEKKLYYGAAMIFCFIGLMGAFGTMMFAGSTTDPRDLAFVPVFYIVNVLWAYAALRMLIWGIKL